jgi:hypothetical protein
MLTEIVIVIRVLAFFVIVSHIFLQIEEARNITL